MFFVGPQVIQNKRMTNFEPQIKKKYLIYILIVIHILIVILFPAHMKVNFAAILDFFI